MFGAAMGQTLSPLVRAKRPWRSGVSGKPARATEGFLSSGTNGPFAKGCTFALDVPLRALAMAAVMSDALLSHAPGARGRLRSRGRREGRNTRPIPGRPMPPLARVARSHAPGVTGSCKLGAPDYGLI